VYRLKGAEYVCGSEYGGWNCRETIRHPSSAVEEIISLEQNPEAFVIESSAEQDIGKFSSICFTAKNEGFTLTYCFTVDGVPTFIKSEGKVFGDSYTYEITATRYWDEVSSSDFTLPDKDFVLAN